MALARGTALEGWTYLSHIDEQKFESLLDQVRELHRVADELTREPARLHDHVRALLSWDRVVVVADGREAVVTTRVEAEPGPGPLVAMLDVVVTTVST